MKVDAEHVSCLTPGAPRILQAQEHNTSGMLPAPQGLRGQATPEMGDSRFEKPQET